MLLYLSQHLIEITGTLLSLVYLYLSIQQRISLWIFGFLSSALYIVVFFQSKFYADMSLQVYYLVVSVYGWISWKKGKADTGEDLPVRKTTMHQGIMLTSLTIAVFFIYYYILTVFTDSPVPIGDSFTTALSITATWMLAKKMIEHWFVWIVVDAVAVGLYVYRGLYPTAFLFIVYSVMAIVGWVQWKKSLDAQKLIM
ncbi:MAG TPA: nicotinamide riboside transporter PnuC [Paludibacter sp.]|jgi:nicotinamide mononucleotide transporter|nr:nicotinamide riboside transporter PnuC [Paludibacter sp.]HOS46261.1 nicotinamide riboside transporter PnuC [Paludibacter sp.]HPM11648.1 nicotinamide riboside transporter PnuC [Paludibacter sp.]